MPENIKSQFYSNNSKQWDLIGGQVGQQVRDKVVVQVAFQVRDRVWGRLRNPIWNQVIEDVKKY